MSQFKKHRTLMSQRIRHHLFIGLTAAMSFSLISFEWTSYDEEEYTSVEAQAGRDIVEVPEIQPFKRKAPVIKHNQILDKFNIKEFIEDTKLDKEPTLDELTKNLKLFDFGSTTDLDAPFEEDLEIGEEAIDYGLLQNRPHFAECANIENKNVQDQCTYLKIKSAVVANLHYPRICVDQGIQGTVELTFVIDEGGNVAEVEVVKGLDPRLDREAASAIKRLPQFVPGRVLNKNVKVRYQMPVAFTIGT